MQLANRPHLNNYNLDRVSLNQRIGNLTAAECLSILSDPSPDSVTGFIGVYRHRCGRYYAKFLKKRISSNTDSPRQAALQLAAWWSYWFGDEWPMYFRSRRSGAISYVPVAGGFKLIVFLMGKPTYLGKRDGTIYPTKEAARHELHLWMRRRYGLFLDWAGLEMRRLVAPRQLKRQRLPDRPQPQQPTIPYRVPPLVAGVR